MTILTGKKTGIARDESSPIRSHLSYDSPVQAICHHSGRYLTRAETNPIWKRFLRQQHDFPGLIQLDHAFAKAAHSEPHQHVFWNRVSLQSIALFAFGPLLLLLVAALFTLEPYVPGGILYIIFWVVLVLMGLLGLGMMIFALLRVVQQEQIYHRQAKGQPPAIIDYPVDGTYQIKAQEKIKIDLDNIDSRQPAVREQGGALTVTVEPGATSWETYKQYREQYQEHPVGEYLHAGAIALEHLNHVQVNDDTLEHDHRLVLRQQMNYSGFDSETGQMNYSGFDSETGQLHPFTFNLPYQLRPSALYPNYSGLPRFPLECEPRLSAHDSRTLDLHFHWRGEAAFGACRLEACTLRIPDDLTPVIKVAFGRYDPDEQLVIWRNRSFRDQSLLLSITFDKPILRCKELITGSYDFRLDGLLSGLQINPGHIWTALGTIAPLEKSNILRETIIQGNITLDLQRLSQEHEYVQPTPPIVVAAPPDDYLIEAIVEVLLEEGFDLQRISRAAPRLDLTGRLDVQLYYWDIVGRRYNPELLDSLDMHVVVSGSDYLHNNGDDKFQPESHIDLRVRCLHDPRNKATPASVDALIGGQGGASLSAKIQQAVQRTIGERPK